MSVFECPIVPAPPETNSTFRPKPLHEFIEHILRRLEADPAVAFYALYPLNRLKEANPKATSTSGHALFFASFLVAGKTLPDIDSVYSNKDMAGITQGMFSLRVVNQMERKLLEDLKWEVRPPDVNAARVFEEHVRKRYSDGPRPWLGPSRRQPDSTTLVGVSTPQNDHYPYPTQPLRPANNTLHVPSKPQHIYAPATACPPLGANTAVPATLPTAHHDPNTPHYPPLLHTVYESNRSYGMPFPVTPEGNQDPSAWAKVSGSRFRPSEMLRSPGDVLVGGYPSTFRSATREPRTVHARDIYATART